MLSSDTKKTFLIYTIFNLLVLLTNLVVVSVVAFFHFQLNHQLGDIENWLSNNAWPIIILVKCFCFIVFFYFYGIGSETHFTRIKKIVKASTFNPSFSILVVCFGIYFLIGSIGNYISKNDYLMIIDIHKILSFSGTLSFYLIDFLVIYILTFNRSKSLLELSGLTFLFYVFSRIVIPYKEHLTVMIALHFFSMLVFSRNRNMGDPLFYLVSVVSLFSVLWGLDPIWGAEFSFMKLEVIDIAFYYIACWCLCLGYYNYRDKKPIMI